MKKPRIGITLGDPAGIGPEIVRRALVRPDLLPDAEYVVIHDTQAFTPGQPTQSSARHAFEALEEAVALGLRGEIDAVVTGPVSKKNMHEVGFDFPGQTEFFANRTATENFAMCLTAPQLTVALVTAHIPLAAVPTAINQAEIIRVGRLLAAFKSRQLKRTPRIAVAGLNPHAGENGDLGLEELEIIGPAIQHLKSQFATEAEWSGPFPPDTIFFQAVNGSYDAVLCMYHDQGLIPLKLLGFDEGVNVTLGLPFPRTSPDHGTAYEIAGKNLAKEDSLIAAIQLAAEMISA